MSLFVCPLCSIRHGKDDYARSRRYNSEICRRGSEEEDGYVHYICEHYHVELALDNAIVQGTYDEELTERILDLSAQVVMRYKDCNVNGEHRKWHFYYTPMKDGNRPRSPEFVNLAYQMRDYPEQVIDVAHQSLMNLSIKYPRYGHVITAAWQDHRLFFDRDGSNSSVPGILKVLTDLGYLRNLEEYDNFSITAAGWQKIDELRKQEQVVRQGFIAMAFREETKPIREAFRKAITEMGYNASVIDEKEHNNQIVPEIFYEIQRSKFVVVDVTYPNLGAYYEAGYAQALGKQVIICCQEDSFKDSSRRPHFDISQKSMIVWTDEADLVRRLKRRIEATVQ